ncbi:hypothetical protein HHL16_06310 [Pseudoflavitalea sp. G-6-1-2]|uniref:hypothetical protein n=1 Tax=Pseudoflavitalea sp. G-6-1-2 TaxID=2728841 RepID=UPI00146E5617|nr:hypothetical protein [Pseudoflavitalea sp. G-6-1-2]NML20477.1 hypothetical protein [Pseudoflavitalea sp. G-6-1-2]
MTSQDQSLDTIKDIKRMMERSSRFISLSGWSGVSAGVCALIGAYFANKRIHEMFSNGLPDQSYDGIGMRSIFLFNDLIVIAALTFIGALITAFLFTFLRTRKHGVPLWDRTVQRLVWNTFLPIAVGGLVLLRALSLGYFELIAPGCLIFYGLALVNASKYTLGEIRYLGYGQLILGIFNLYDFHNGIMYWALGFGVLHIVYGLVMWWKYERVSQ